MESKNLEYAGFFIRLLALSIDFILLNIATYFIFSSTSDYFFYDFDYFSTLEFKQSLLILDVYGPIDFLYYYFDLLKSILIPSFITLSFWFFFSATPGKILVGARIVDANTGGRPKTISLIVRYLGYFLSSIFFLGFFWVIFDVKKQGWHDKLSRTVVVRKKKKDVSFSAS
jgi:uncharacterized RDD family membrane protein YckC